MRKFTRQLQLFGFASGIALAAVVYMVCAILFFEEARADEAPKAETQQVLGVGYWYKRFSGDSRTELAEAHIDFANALTVWAYSRARQELYPNEPVSSMVGAVLVERVDALIVCSTGEGSWGEAASLFAKWLAEVNPGLNDNFAMTVFIFAEQSCEFTENQGKDHT